MPGKEDEKSHAERREEALATEATGWDTRTIHAAEPGDIPIIDISMLLNDSGEPRTDLPRKQFDQMAKALGSACREVGFFSLVGHRVPQPLIDAVFEQNRRFHATELEAKLSVAMDQPGAPQGVGYLPLMHRKLPRRPVGNNNEAFLLKRDGDLRLADNLWPSADALPDFRNVLVSYAAAMEKLALSLLPLYAASLGVADDFFAQAFTDPLYRLRLTHYPVSQEPPRDGTKSVEGFGIAPHVDTTFLTILAQDAPGLVVYSERRRCWITVPLVQSALVVNTGELLRQWTNDEFMSVKHFANNSASTRSRYSVPFFFNANSDYPMACVPTCTGPDRPIKYPAVSYAQSQGVVQGE